jgi:hypothetical protein
VDVDMRSCSFRLPLQTRFVSNLWCASSVAHLTLNMGPDPYLKIVRRFGSSA